MMEIVNNIKDFVSYYNALVKEIERITPLKKGIESVLKSDCDCVYYENKEIDVVDVDRQISEMPQLPPCLLYTSDAAARSFGTEKTI